jgi:hypothetical protein
LIVLLSGTGIGAFGAFTIYVYQEAGLIFGMSDLFGPLCDTTHAFVGFFGPWVGFSEWFQGFIRARAYMYRRRDSIVFTSPAVPNKFELLSTSHAQSLPDRHTAYSREPIFSLIKISDCNVGRVLSSIVKFDSSV